VYRTKLQASPCGPKGFLKPPPGEARITGSISSGLPRMGDEGRQSRAAEIQTCYRNSGKPQCEQALTQGGGQSVTKNGDHSATQVPGIGPPAKGKRKNQARQDISGGNRFRPRRQCALSAKGSAAANSPRMNSLPGLFHQHAPLEDRRKAKLLIPNLCRKRGPGALRFDAARKKKGA